MLLNKNVQYAHSYHINIDLIWELNDEDMSDELFIRMIRSILID